jgi:dienelactone hydrolase
MKFICSVLFIHITWVLNAQYLIGHLSHAFTDTFRNNRQINCEVYYPALAEGDNVECAAGTFPVVVFGHGFVMSYQAYGNIRTDLVPEGYILLFPTTEAGIPDHQAFGDDLRFVATQCGDLNNNGASPLFGHLSDQKALAGHSMGGGASWLAAADNPDIQCVVGLAPAETNPSAVTAAASVNTPVLVLSGSADQVTPPSSNHIPMYEATASPCKALVSILEGSHCYFANAGSLCDLGEFTPGQMTRSEQQEITRNLMLYWLNFYLKSDLNAIDLFESYCAEHGSIELTTSCDFTGIWLSPDRAETMVFPNPFSHSFVVKTFAQFEDAGYRLYSPDGRTIPMVVGQGIFSNGQFMTELTPAEDLSSGIYLFEQDYPPFRSVIIRE